MVSTQGGGGALCMWEPALVLREHSHNGSLSHNITSQSRRLVAICIFQYHTSFRVRRSYFSFAHTPTGHSHQLHIRSLRLVKEHLNFKLSWKYTGSYMYTIILGNIPAELRWHFPFSLWCSHSCSLSISMDRNAPYIALGVLKHSEYQVLIYNYDKQTQQFPTIHLGMWVLKAFQQDYKLIS